MQFTDPGVSGTRVLKDVGPTGSRNVRDLDLKSDFNYIFSPRSAYVAGTGTNTVVKDANILSGAVSRSWNNLIISWSTGNSQPLTIVSSNPNLPVATDGTITPTADGSTTITLSVPGLGQKAAKITASSLIAGANFTSFATGSLALHMNNQINALIAGKTAPTFTKVTRPNTEAGNQWGYHFEASSNVCDMFLSAPVTGGTPQTTTPLTRNTSLWAASLDLSAIPWSFSIGGMNAIPITKRDLLAAGHYHVGIGTQYTFIGTDGVHYVRTVVAQKAVPDVTAVTSDGWDLWVHTLDSDLPAAVTIPQMVPSNIWSYLPQPQYSYPLIYITQDYRMLIGGVNTVFPWGPQLTSNDLNQQTWYCSVRGGDSSSPMFFLINGKLVVLAPLGSSGLNAPANLAAINATIVANAAFLASSSTPYPTPYTLSPIDLSAFTQF